jgi:tRNA 2-selenouridine synthase
MPNSLAPVAFLNLLVQEKIPLFDVRSPGEFGQGHIPGAFSLPLFSDEQRKTVGTLYKVEGMEQAFLLGLDFVGPKMSGFVKQVGQLAPGRKVLLYCWRGGMRSGSMAWLLRSAGFEVWTLQGGYKSYRKEVLNTPFEPKKFFVLGGFTGSGKSEILQSMHQIGVQTLDLEKLACHKGSAFGAIGQNHQPTQEQFENELFARLFVLNHSEPIWVEDESKAIGKIRIPESWFVQMRSAKVFFVDIPYENRLNHILSTYGKASKEDLEVSILKLKKRLGGLAMKVALDALNNNDLQSAAKIILNYYDKAYAHGLHERAPEQIVKLRLKCEKPEEAALILKGLGEKLN